MRKKLYQMVLSSGSTQGLLLISNLVMPYWYSTTAIGSYGFFVTIASIFAVISAWRLDYFAFFASDFAPLTQESALLCALVILFFGGTTLLVLSVFGQLTFTTSVCIGITCSSFSFFYLMTQWALLKKQYVLFAQARVLQGVGLLILLLAFKKYNYYGLIAASVLSQSGTGLYLFKQLQGHLRLDSTVFWNAVSYQKRARSLNVLATLMQNIAPALPIMCGAFLFSKNDLGIYFLLSQLIGGAGSVLRRSILAVFSAELMQNGMLNPEALKTIQITFWSGLLAAFIMSTIVFFLSPLIANYGQWLVVKALFMPVVFFYMIDAFMQPIGALLPAIGHHVNFFTLELIRLLSLFILVLIAYRFGLSIQQFIYGYSVIMALGYGTAAVLFLIFTTHVYHGK